MLVLKRKKDGSITVGNDIHIVVLKIDRGQVSLGIDAPKDVRILRDDAKKINPPPSSPSQVA
jgi:carbon storage regulator